MKKLIAMAFFLVIASALVGCGNRIQKPELSDAAYEKGYAVGYGEGYHAGHEEGYREGKELTGSNERRVAQFSGSFTATVEKLLPDYYALPGKTIAVVHFFQDGPFLLRFQEDIADKFIEGKPYVFEFRPFEVSVADDAEYPSISDYMYSINITGYRIAEEDEIGLESKMATVEIVLK